ncbi:MAG: class I SAM-dependent methyltransferase [Actinomycetia bacterium]|nr:class I SAM-dependent methyltransferase [Actinomycetes bacterium]
MATGGRGGEFYEVDDVRRAYLRHRHDGLRSPNTVMEEPAFLDALGSVSGCRVLDLGCGDGSTANLILSGGATSYVGVDGSGGMVETARRTAGGDRVRFVHGDIEDVDVGAGEFDVVISRMAFHYIERLDVVVERVHRALSEGGRLVFSVVHPVITGHDTSGDGPRTSWMVDGYFDRGPRERSWFGSTVVWRHRTIEDYVRVVTRHGFRLDSLSECEPRAELLLGDADELARRRRVPLMLLVGATRS